MEWRIRSVKTFSASLRVSGAALLARKRPGSIAPWLLDLAAEEYPAEIDLFLRLADKPCDSGGVFDLEVGPVTVNVAEAELFREARSTS